MPEPTETHRYGCSTCGYTLHTLEPPGTFKPPVCPACLADGNADAKPLEPIATFGPVPGTALRVAPESKLTVNLQTRVPQSVVDQVDAVRGDQSRSEWLRELVQTQVGQADDGQIGGVA